MTDTPSPEALAAWRKLRGRRPIFISDRDGALALDAFAERRSARSPLLVEGEFTAHSGLRLPFKIDCDALTREDLSTIAAEVARTRRWREVYGVPRGGVRLAEALRRYSTGAVADPILIVDDVLTTGASMEEAKLKLNSNVIGFVIFARGPCPNWVTPMFCMRETVDKPAGNGEL